MKMCIHVVTRDRGEINIPNRPVVAPRAQLPSCQSSHTTSPPLHSGHHVSTLPPPPKSLPLRTNQSQSRHRTPETRKLDFQDQAVVIKHITPRSFGTERPGSQSSGAKPQEQKRPLSTGSTGKGRVNFDNQIDPRRSGSFRFGKSPTHSDTVVSVITPQQSGSVVLPTGRQSITNYRNPRQSIASLRSTSYRSTRERMAEVDEEGGLKRVYDRRDDR